MAAMADQHKHFQHTAQKWPNCEITRGTKIPNKGIEYFDVLVVAQKRLRVYSKAYLFRGWLVTQTYKNTTL